LPAKWDVLVIGGGLAGLAAALTARACGASVLLLERAPHALRGGNARHARNFRFAHARPTRHAPGIYTTDAFAAELSKVSGDNGELAASLVLDSADVADWLLKCGVSLQDTEVGTIPFSRRTAFLLGGGKAMVNALYRKAQAMGVAIAYDSQAVALAEAPDSAWTTTVASAGGSERVVAGSVVAAAGGPGGDPDWLSAHLGPSAENIVVRGGVHSDGRAMMWLLENGALAVGDPATCHMVAVDARGPRFDGGIVTRITAIPFGLVVDRNGARVEAADDDDARTHYARWGPRIARSPGGAAFLFLDADGRARAAPTAFAPISAESLPELAAALRLDPIAVQAAAVAFNAERPGGRPRLATPPFFGIPLRAGLTFVHYGLQVDPAMRIVMRDGRTGDGLFAAGMIMAANVLKRGYLAGFGLTLAIVTGRRAGEGAARHALG
jgi:tricarballylate dehydrogenase